MEIDPLSLPLKDRYKLLIGAVVPRPIAWVATISPDARENLAPFSFFNGVGSDPLTLLFCPGNAPDGGEKDTLRNCKPQSEGGTGEFVVHLVDRRLARAMAVTAERLPYGESEIELAGLRTTPSHVVRPPRLRDSPVAFECRTVQVVRLNPGVPGGGNVVIGEVLHVHVDDAVIDEGLHIDPRALDPVGRLAGMDYCGLGEIFALPRGRAALEG
ncbi:MAG: flavin reductase family protein [Thermoanaerobaculia bacterium]